MATKENNLIKEIQIKVSKLGWRLFRNQTGTAYQSAEKPIHIKNPGMIKVEPGDVILKNARYISFGLVKGGHDLIGWKPLLITQEMVGKTIAVFTSREVKTGKLRPTSEQVIFEKNVNSAGGDAKIVYSLEEIE